MLPPMSEALLLEAYPTRAQGLRVEMKSKPNGTLLDFYYGTVYDTSWSKLPH